MVSGAAGTTAPSGGRHCPAVLYRQAEAGSPKPGGTDARAHQAGRPRPGHQLETAWTDDKDLEVWDRLTGNFLAA